MYFSNETVDAAVSSMTPGQLRAALRMMEGELALRGENRRARMMRKAKFPAVKTFDGYDFSQVAFPDGYGPDDIRGLGFVERAQDFVFHGQTGRGKTHLAIAIGTACIERGVQARFFTAAGFVMALTRASASGQLDALMRDISKCGLLIVDELGYVPLDVAGARMLFQVMSDCYEKRSVVITTNIEFSKWGTVFGDDKMAAALIDRLVHHGRLLEFNGTSRRMDEALMLGKSRES